MRVWQERRCGALARAVNAGPGVNIALRESLWWQSYGRWAGASKLRSDKMPTGTLGVLRGMRQH